MVKQAMKARDDDDPDNVGVTVFWRRRTTRKRKNGEEHKRKHRGNRPADVRGGGLPVGVGQHAPVSGRPVFFLKPKVFSGQLRS